MARRSFGPWVFRTIPWAQAIRFVTLGVFSVILSVESPGQSHQTDAATQQESVLRPQLKINQSFTMGGGVVYSGDGLTVAYSSSSTVTQVMSVRSRRTIVSLPETGVLAMAANGQTVAIGTETGDLTIWNPSQTRTIEASHQSRISSLAMTPDGQWIVSGDVAGSVKFWHLPNDKPVWTAQFSEDIQSLGVANNGSRVLVCWGRGAAASPEPKSAGSRIVDGKTGHPLKMLDQGKGYGIIAGGLSGDGKIAATVRDLTDGLTLWDVESGRPTSVLPKGGSISQSR